VTILVHDVAPASLTYTLNPAVYVKGTTIAANAPSSTGGAVVSYAVSPSLPAGLSLNLTTGVITGTPSAILAQGTWTITATNSGGNTSVGLKLTVNDAPPASVIYTPSTLSCTLNLACGPATPASSGGTVVTWSVSPALPAGLAINAGTGVIGGTPTALATTAAYTITATNTGGSSTATLSLSVTTLNTLTVTLRSVGGGGGKVTSTPVGIDCGATCQASFSSGATVSLVATPKGNHVFAGWSGDCSGATCSLSMAAAHDVTATFGPATNLFFVTANQFSTATVTSLAAGDLTCNTAAAAAKLPGTYKAWLSSSTVAAPTRLGTARGWVMVDGSPFVDTSSDLLNNRFLYTSLVDENGARSVNGQVMTGTTFNGTTGANCNDFSSTQPDSQMQIGANAGTGGSWTDVGTSLCTNAFSLYCFGVDKAVPVTVPPATARKAFLTAAGWTPGGGLASADALCAAEASAASLPGTYRAWLETSSAGGLSRFDLTGLPWARPDGVFLTTQIADLTNGNGWLAHPNQLANGTYAPNSRAFWGNGNNFASQSNCKNWTSALAADSGNVSLVDYPGGSVFTCNQPNGRLLCLQN
jgi:hypothetical protein